MTYTAKISGYDGRTLTVIPINPIDRELLQHQVDLIEIRLTDGREITAKQRGKIFAIIRDISDWCGHDPEEIRRILTWNFRELDGRDDFSLSDTDVTTAKEFITFLIDFCLRWSIPTRDTLLKLCDDMDKYLYACLEHRKCALCGKVADVHHVDRVGMGFDREKIVHVGLNAVALCREHHGKAHENERKLFEDNHIYGIELDEYLCQKLKLRSKKKC